MKQVVIELWSGSYRTLEYLQNLNTIDAFLPKKTTCLFNKPIDRV